jgi:ATP-dependent RNA helicase DDX35
MVEQEKVLRVRSQLGKLLQQLGEGKQQLENRDVKLVAKAVTAGFFSHAARLESDGGNTYRSVRGNQELYIHPASVLFRASPKWVVFHSTIFLERYYMWNVTAIDPVWLTEVASHFYHFGNTLAGAKGGR